MKIGTLSLLLAAIFVGGLAAYAAYQIIAARPAAGPETTIVAAAEPLGFGTTLTEENVVELPWKGDIVPAGTFSTKAELLKDGHRVVLSPVEKNEPVLASRITKPGEKGGLSALIEPGMRAVTIRVDDVKGVGGFVTPGDRVDVFLTGHEAKGDAENSYADVLLQNIKVLGVDQLANANQQTASVAKAVTVEVTTEEAQKLALAQGVGTLSLALRQTGSDDPEATRRVTSMDLGLGKIGVPPAAAKAVEKVAEQGLAGIFGSRTTASVRVYHGLKPVDVTVYHEVTEEARAN